MIGRIRTFYRRHARRFSAVFFGAVVLVWLLGPIAAGVLKAEQSALASFAILVVMLATIQDYLESLTRPPSTVIHSDQQQHNRAIFRLLRDFRIDHVRMIEYDSESTKELIFFFLRRGATVHCLLQHPDAAVNDSQRRRTVLQVKTRNEEYADYLDQVTFSYYRDIASVRARKIDDRWLSVGAYTYDRRGDREGPQVWGHNNPVALVDLEAAGSVPLAVFFDKVFDNLLQNAESWDEVASQFELYITRSRDHSAPRLVPMRAAAADVARRSYELPERLTFSRLACDGLPNGLGGRLRPLIAACFDEREWTLQTVDEVVLNRGTLKAVFLVEAGADIAGCATLHATSHADRLTLHWLAVAQAYRRRGIGRALVIEAARTTDADAYRSLDLETEEYRTAARSLYQELGFLEVPVGDSAAAHARRQPEL